MNTSTPPAKHHPHNVVVLKKGNTNKGVVDLALAAIIIAALAIVVFPIAYSLSRSENEKAQQWGAILYILAWLHVVALLVLAILIIDKFRKVPAHQFHANTNAQHGYTLKKGSTNKGVATLSFVSIILGALATVVFPLAFLFSKNDDSNIRNFGAFLYILAWLHVVALLVLAALIMDKFEKVHTPVSGMAQGTQGMGMMRSGYAIPPPAY
jgi:hypothetical protein